MPKNHEIKFFVYMVESPSAVDIYHDRKENQLIEAATKLNEVPFVTKTAVNSTAFRASLIYGMQEAIDFFKDRLPILHLSMHGDEEGIALTSDEHISWKNLKELLIPINKVTNNNLILCLSSCSGYSGISMSMDLTAADHPYFAIIGCGSSPTWSEAAISYATLYHHLSKGEYISDTIEKMRIASGKEDFYFELSANTQKFYIDYVASCESGAPSTIAPLNDIKPVGIEYKDYKTTN